MSKSRAEKIPSAAVPVGGQWTSHKSGTDQFWVEEQNNTQSYRLIVYMGNAVLKSHRFIGKRSYRNQGTFELDPVFCNKLSGETSP